MRRFLPVYAIVFLLMACRSEQPEKLEEAFLLSIQKNDFGLLNRFLPDKNFYVSQVSNETRTETELNDIIAKKAEEINLAWQNTYYNVAAKKIDLSKVIVREVIYYDPFPNDTISEAMIVRYEYKGNTWDDLQFIVSRKTGGTVLLNIPGATRSFSMVDRDLRATNEARAWIELRKPDFKTTIGELSAKLIAAAKANDLAAFGRYLVYHGDDERKQWRVPLDMNDSLERSQALHFMQRVSRNMEGCDDYQTGNVVTNRKAEGLWITWPLNCGNRIVTLSYLWINNKLLLGDTGADITQP